MLRLVGGGRLHEERVSIIGVVKDFVEYQEVLSSSAYFICFTKCV